MYHWMETYTNVMKYYDEPHRHYHNANHIHRMFAEAMIQNIVLNDAQTLAILFHDIVYIPGLPSGENERASSKMLDVLVSTKNVDIDTIIRAKSIILDTINHEPTSIESAFVLDLDLHELGTKRYDENGKSIRKEFHFVPDDLYIKGRISFLEAYLAKIDLFHTIQFHDLYEDKARKNMERELGVLKAKHVRDN